MQRQTAVTAYLKSKQLLLFALVRQHTDKVVLTGVPLCCPSKQYGVSEFFIIIPLGTPRYPTIRAVFSFFLGRGVTVTPAANTQFRVIFFKFPGGGGHAPDRPVSNPLYLRLNRGPVLETLHKLHKKFHY